jgi:hypothetical protein
MTHLCENLRTWPPEAAYNQPFDKKYRKPLITNHFQTNVLENTASTNRKMLVYGQIQNPLIEVLNDIKK